MKPNKVTKNNTTNTLPAIGSTFACAGGRLDFYRQINDALKERVYGLVDVSTRHPTPTEAVMLAVQKVPQKYV